MQYKRALSILLAGLIATVLLVGSVFAQDDMEADMQAITIAATEDGLVVPETLEAGWVEITFENSTEMPFYSIVARLDEEATIDEFMGALMGVFAGELDVPPANFLGSPLALPDETQTAMYNLEAGMYVVVSVAGEQPEMTTFVVEGEMAEGDMEIEADFTLAFADFVFGLPSELTAGEQIWEIDNRGEQWHEMVFLSVPEGTTMEDAMMLLMPPEAEEGEEMAEEGGPPEGLTYLWSPMSSGNSAFMQIDLAPGTYLVLCFIPDSTSEEGLSHAEQGMMQIVTVVEAEEE